MLASRVVPALFVAGLAACTQDTKIEYVEVPGPPSPSIAAPTPPAPPANEIAINVAASQITGSFTLNGGAFPANQLEKGAVLLHGAHRADFLLLGQTFDQDYGAFVVNGSYDFRYVFDSGGAVVPTNPNAEVISDRAIAGNGAIPVDVGVVAISPTFTLNGGTFPASQYDGANFYLQPVGSEALIYLGASQKANAPVKVARGTYNVIYDYRQGAVSPINKGARVQENVVLTTDQQLPVNVVASGLRCTFTLNGSPFPQSEYNDANFYLRDKLTGAQSRLMNSHDPPASVVAIDATYDVLYRAETSGGGGGVQVPINNSAVVVNDFVLSGGAALAHDVSAVTIGATVTLNGSPFPVSEYDDGIILLHDPQTKTDTTLGNTHSPFSNLVLIPGTYDVIFTHQSGQQVPQNRRGTVAKAVVVSNGNLDVNVVGVQVGANVTLNGAAFKESEYEDANFVLSGAQSATDIVLGNSHEKNPSVMVMPGTYDLLYRHETGVEVPQNSNYRLLADQVVAQNTTLSTNIQTRLVRLSATLNDAPFPQSPANTAQIFARSREGDDVLLLRTHGVQDTPMLIIGDYELFYRHIAGSSVPRNPWAKVGVAAVN